MQRLRCGFSLPLLRKWSLTSTISLLEDVTLFNVFVSKFPVFNRISQHHFASSSTLHQQPTLRTPAHASQVRRTFFSCAGPRAWNSLPSSLRELTHTKTFKRQLKPFFFNNHTNRRNICLLCLGLHFTLYYLVLFCDFQLFSVRPIVIPVNRWSVLLYRI